MKRIAVLSCANTGNFGDDIIFESLKRVYNLSSSRDNEYTHFLRITANNIDIINNHDMLIIGGGEIISHSDILKQVTNNNIKIPYTFFSVGIGSEEDIAPFKDKIKHFLFSVRTLQDFEILEKLNIKNKLLREEPIDLLKEKIMLRKEYIGVNFKNLGKINFFASSMAKELDELVNKGIKIKLISLNKKSRGKIDYYKEEIFISDCNDLDLMVNIQNQMKNKIDILSYEEKPVDFFNSLNCFKGIICERLHCAVAAYHLNINFRVIPYHNKINKFLNHFKLKNKTVKLDEVSTAIQKLWQEEGLNGNNY